MEWYNPGRFCHAIFPLHCWSVACTCIQGKYVSNKFQIINYVLLLDYSFAVVLGAESFLCLSYSKNVDIGFIANFISNIYAFCIWTSCESRYEGHPLWFYIGWAVIVIHCIEVLDIFASYAYRNSFGLYRTCPADWLRLEKQFTARLSFSSLDSFFKVLFF